MSTYSDYVKAITAELARGSDGELLEDLGYRDPEPETPTDESIAVTGAVAGDILTATVVNERELPEVEDGLSTNGLAKAAAAKKHRASHRLSPRQQAIAQGRGPSDDPNVW